MIYKVLRNINDEAARKTWKVSLSTPFQFFLRLILLHKIVRLCISKCRECINSIPPAFQLRPTYQKEKVQRIAIFQMHIINKVDNFQEKMFRYAPNECSDINVNFSKWNSLYFLHIGLRFRVLHACLEFCFIFFTNL